MRIRSLVASTAILVSALAVSIVDDPPIDWPSPHTAVAGASSSGEIDWP